jgi:hypothetical protein
VNDCNRISATIGFAENLKICPQYLQLAPQMAKRQWFVVYYYRRRAQVSPCSCARSLG